MPSVTFLFYQYSLYVPKLTLLLKSFFIFGTLLNFRGDTRPNSGEIRSDFHNRPKSNKYSLYFYQYALYIHELIVTLNSFWKNLHSKLNSARFNASTHYQTQKGFMFWFPLLLLNNCIKSSIDLVCECLNTSWRLSYMRVI